MFVIPDLWTEHVTAIIGRSPQLSWGDLNGYKLNNNYYDETKKFEEENI